MLRIGLTGGIGAGKSTVSATFDECGGIIVDGDKIAREVVEPGTEGLAALVEAFGEDILLPDGALDRPALAAKAFGDEESRKTLNGIVHPLVGRRREEIISGVSDDDIVVEDIPLLVESGMAPMFPLVVVVHADAEERVRRLVEQRGMPEKDARARIAAQASDEQRRAVADVWLDNSASQEELVAAARRLWEHRIVPFAHNVAARRTVTAPVELKPSDPVWTDQARRIVDRLRTTCGHHAVRVDHIGSTSVPELAAKDVIDVQVTVPSLDVADELDEALTTAWCTSPATNRSPALAAPSPSSTASRCGTSAFTPRQTPVDPRTSTSGSTAGPTSSSRCCSRSGCAPTPMSATSTSRSSGTR